MEVTLEKKLQGFQLIAQEKVRSHSLNLQHKLYYYMVTAVTGNTMLDPGQEGAYLRAGTYQAAGACLHRILA